MKDACSAYRDRHGQPGRFRWSLKGEELVPTNAFAAPSTSCLPLGISDRPVLAVGPELPKPRRWSKPSKKAGALLWGSWLILWDATLLYKGEGPSTSRSRPAGPQRLLNPILVKGTLRGRSWAPQKPRGPTAWKHVTEEALDDETNWLHVHSITDRVALTSYLQAAGFWKGLLGQAGNSTPMKIWTIGLLDTSL